MRTLRITVKPKAREASLTRKDDGTWEATVKSAPVEGKANEELRRLVADHFGVAPSRVSLKSGAGSRFKTVVVDDR